MVIETKVCKIGDSLGIVLPKEAVEALAVEDGAKIILTEAPGSALRMMADRNGFGEKMKIAERGMQKYRNALRKLSD